MNLPFQLVILIFVSRKVYFHRGGKVAYWYESELDSVMTLASSTKWSSTVNLHYNYDVSQKQYNLIFRLTENTSWEFERNIFASFGSWISPKRNVSRICMQFSDVTFSMYFPISPSFKTRTFFASVLYTYHKWTQNSEPSFWQYNVHLAHQRQCFFALFSFCLRCELFIK